MKKEIKKFLNLLELKVNEFISDSKEHIIKKYKEMLLQHTLIELYFDEIIYSKIEKNIISIQNEI